MGQPSFNAIAFGCLVAGSLALAAKVPRVAPPPPVYERAAAPVPVQTPAEYGRALIEKTAFLIGPGAADPAKRLTGNGLACASCHLQAGTQPFGLALTATYRAFPRYIARENEVRTLTQRINGCMERSMNGRPMPADGPEMLAMLAYIQSLGGAKPAKDESLAPIAWPEAAADVAHGAKVYATMCAACHGPSGQGARLSAVEAAAQGKRYQFPPLWGPDSYNDGAGMARTITAARFVRYNMPLGTTAAAPVLSVGDAFDVMAFVNSQQRPHMAGLDRDFPDRAKKPVDAGYAPFVGPFPPEQHRLGPWQPIEAWLKENGAAARTMD